MNLIVEDDMAFDANLVAIQWSNDEYKVISSITAEIDIDSLNRKQRLADISSANSYADYGAIVSKTDFKKTPFTRVCFLVQTCIWVV
ncbi:MAG: hypothetical protein HN936_08995 [Bacteroidetes bacterium]|nr:hypothetical protein [Candidatus Neomarinimicrobiota bacterium]MBT7093371.1 hypothetical protein [Bacteroidota bacterium]MBT7580092.1 hypothetical protein [Candidatus Neomarinimicrobiota bacterium]